MAIIKCKMCGGDIELAADKTFGTCEYCGSTMTFPKVDDEQRAAAFNRGNHFRRIGEFDKALAVYERIVREDDTDAEAHWCCALCRFGIEYVEDPATYEYLPTCHRASFDSFMEDVDYLAALEHSDGITRRQYQKDAAKIAEVQRGILATSQNTEPYDVFICYKESDAIGDRTRDSLLAQDIYYQLTEQGRKVFFARITLEDIAGAQYEPYIFAALNSAKVMIVVGTKPEYLNAVWVKNEWSRFLAMMKKDRHKLLLPCYRDMDPYDMPEALSVLQSYDMSKIGFIQDLTRGIAKVLDAEKKSVTEKETIVQQRAIPANTTAPLLKRAFMFLEDGDWNSANEYCEKVLDIDPENADAYLGKLMAELRVTRQTELKHCATPFDERNNYQKVVRFADEKLKTELAGYLECIRARNEIERLDGIYNRACKAMKEAHSEKTYKDAAKIFESIPDYKDSSELAQKCYDQVEVVRKDEILAAGKKQMSGDLISSYRTAIFYFEKIPGWRDADERIVICNQKIEEIKAKQETAHLERERQKEIARKEAEKKAKRNKKIVIISTSIVCVIIVFIIVLNTIIIPNGKYNDAIALMDAGKYTEAISAFEALDGYKDSATKIAECNTAILDGKYNDAIALMDAGKYTEAISAFEALDGYKDSATKIAECNTAILDGKYNDAIALMDAGNIVEAYEALVALEGYKDSTDKANSIYDKYKVEKLKVAKVGDYVFFGAYEQDNNTSNGKENVEWLVLEIKDGKALVISKYALDCKQYNTSYTDVTWETCTLRKWLNNDFINAAFSADEKAMIPTVTVSADKNPDYNTNPGNATQDQVFLLSIPEANKYFNSDSARQCKPTDYAFANGVYVNSSNGNCWWWLRSPGHYQDSDASVRSGGDVGEFGSDVNRGVNAVRPALWIDLSAIQ